MRHRNFLLIAGLAALSCTAYIDPPRPSARRDETFIEVVLRRPLPAASGASSMAADRLGNVCYTENAGWILASVGWDGSEIFRLDLAPPNGILMTGGTDGYWLLNDLEGRLRCFDRKGQLLSESAYSGISACAGAATMIGDIYLLDGDNARVKVVDGNGHDLRSFQLGMPGGAVFRPGAIAVDVPRNLLAVADSRNGRVVFYNIYGARQGLLEISVGTHPQAVGFDHLGRLWACRPEEGKVAVYAFDGKLWALRSEVDLRQPYAVALSPFGSGIVAEAGNLVFVKF